MKCRNALAFGLPHQLTLLMCRPHSLLLFLASSIYILCLSGCFFVCFNSINIKNGWTDRALIFCGTLHDHGKVYAWEKFDFHKILKICLLFVVVISLQSTKRKCPLWNRRSLISLVCYKEVIDKILLDVFVFWFAVTEAVKNYKSLKNFHKIKGRTFFTDFLINLKKIYPASETSI